MRVAYHGDTRSNVAETRLRVAANPETTTMSRLPRAVRPVWLAVMAALVLGSLAACSPESVMVTASSEARGTSAAALANVAASVPEPQVRPHVGVPPTLGDAAGPRASPHTGDVTWRSSGEAKGAWLRIGWPRSRYVNHIRIDGAGGASSAYENAVVRFNDGSSVFVTPDADGNVRLDIPARQVTWAVLQFATVADGNPSVALRAFAIDDSGAELGPASQSIPSVSSAANGVSAAALDDGDIAAGRVGGVWSPAPGDSTPWAGYSWRAPVALASVQLAGPSTAKSPVLRGNLVFSDGSSIKVSGIASGSDPLSTIAFTPRIVDWIRFDPAINGGGHAIALGEFRPVAAGSTPAVWPTHGGISVSSQEAGSCTTSSTAVGRSQDSALALVCPGTGSSVGPAAHIVVAGPPGSTVSAAAWQPPSGSGSGVVVFLTSATLGLDGRAQLDFPTTKLPHGPFAVRITVDETSVSGADIPLYVQLNNTSGVSAPSPSFAPKGMTLQFDDEFTSALSVSRSGSGTRYGAAKVDLNSASEFGDAVLADPAAGLDTLATLNDNALRLRVQPLGSKPDPNGFGRHYAGGLLSSLRSDGSGFSAQYGYYEARILAPAGRGSWPAFWMADSQVAAVKGASFGEVDAVELYGQNTVGSCHSIHNWNTPNSTPNIHCLSDNGAEDWALAWHSYGVQIRPNGADYYIDGRKVESLDNLTMDTNPYYFMFDLALGGGWPIMIDPTGGSLDMYVDWVRVYT